MNFVVVEGGLGPGGPSTVLPNVLDHAVVILAPTRRRPRHVHVVDFVAEFLGVGALEALTLDVEYGAFTTRRLLAYLRVLLNAIGGEATVAVPAIHEDIALRRRIRVHMTTATLAIVVIA